MTQVPKIKLVYDRRKEASNTRHGRIELRITAGSRQKFISTGLTAMPREWDEAGQQVKNCGDANEKNQVLLNIRRKVLAVISTMMDSGNIDLAAIPVLLKQETVTITFLEYVLQRMEAKQVTDHTHKSYVTMYNKLVEFGRIKVFADITPAKVRAFGEWLHSYTWKQRSAGGRQKTHRYSQASIYKLTSNLSLFISDAVVDGYITENPYVTRRMNEKKGGTRIDQYLTPEEVKRIAEATMPTAAVARSRDLFLLQCHTGLAYIDLMTYDFKKHRTSEDMSLCHGTRHKTGTEFVFLLTRETREILERYKYRMPTLSNQKYNAHLKIMGDAAGINRPITSHMGRRTAGSIWLNSGIPIDVVAKCLGHQSTQVTQRAYAKILDTTVEDAFRRVNENRPSSQTDGVPKT